MSIRQAAQTKRARRLRTPATSFLFPVFPDGRHWGIRRESPAGEATPVGARLQRISLSKEIFFESRLRLRCHGAWEAFQGKDDLDRVLKNGKSRSGARSYAGEEESCEKLGNYLTEKFLTCKGYLLHRTEQWSAS
jgi:hypothetical protein